ncbi:hypothetical protein NX059_003099 [Plenodomus lindquistii]|nr:hypothetical protein NX059_003099 [Plenodomus lindquistii]
MEYVTKHYPAPGNVDMSSLSISPRFGTNAGQEASRAIVAKYLSYMPDLMDAELAGAATLFNGDAASKFMPSLIFQHTFTGVLLVQTFWAFSTTLAAIEALLQLMLNPGNSTKSSVTLTMNKSTFHNYIAFYSTISGSEVAGSKGFSSSRLLGRRELIGTPTSDVMRYLKSVISSENVTAGKYATIGLQGGPGACNTSAELWSTLNPAWCPAYVHFISGGVNSTSLTAGTPKKALDHAAEWNEQNRELVWREWVLRRVHE